MTYFRKDDALERVLQVASIAGLKVRVLGHRDSPDLARYFEYLRSRNDLAGAPFDANGDLTFELTNPDFDKSGTPVVYNWNKSDLAYKLKAPLQWTNRDTSATLIQVSMNRGVLSAGDAELVDKVAHAISILDGNDKIGFSHTAEATQYCIRICDEEAVNLLSGDIQFGPGITVSRFEKDPEHIKAAIDHLNNELSKI